MCGQLGTFIFVNLAQKRTQGPPAADRVADIRVIIRQYIDVRLPYPVKKRFGTIFLGKPPPVLGMDHARIHAVKSFAFLLDSAPG